MLHIALLGTPSVRWQNTPIDLPRRTVRGLLFYLACHQAPIAREKLLSVFFGHMSDAAARSRLRHTLSQLRQALSAAGVSPTLLQTDHSQVTLNSGHCHIDVRVLEAALLTGKPELWPDFTTLLRGQFLDGLHLPDAPEFEDWLRTERERFGRISLEALLQAGRHHITQTQWAAAKQCADHAIRLDTFCEEAYLLLMECQAMQGERTLVIRQYELLRERLLKGLNTAPSLAAESRYRQLLGDLQLPINSRSHARVYSIIDLPFVGRAAEIKQMVASYTRMLQPQHQIILIDGAAGQGKTQLVDEFIGQITAYTGADVITPPLVLLSTCYPSTQSVPYHAIADALRTAAQTTITSPNSDLPQHWQQNLLRLISGANKTQQLKENASVVRNAQEARSNVWEGLVDILVQLTAASPVLLVIHDLQWCDVDSLALLTYLCHRTAHLRWMWVATSRDGAYPPLQRLQEELRRLPKPRFLHIELPPLTLTEIDTLTRQVQGLPQSPVPKASQRLLHETEGNALFLVETLRGLIGDLEGTPEQWQQIFQTLGLHDAQLPLPLPTSIRTMIEGRTALLSAPARRVLGAAAIIGRSFEFELLSQVTGCSEAELADSLDELCGQHFLQDSEQRVYFKHAKYQEAIYASLTVARRRLWHVRVAEVLMQSSDTATMAFEVVYHAEQGRLWKQGHAQDQATRWYALAAQAARDTFATTIAIAHYRSALAALGSPTTPPTLTAVNLYAGLGEMLRLQADYDAAITAYLTMQQVGQACDDAVAQARAWQGLALVYNNQGNHSRAIESTQLAISLASSRGAHHIVAAALYDEGWAHFRLGRLAQALECAGRVIGISEAQGDSMHLALGHNLLGVTYNLLGDFAQAQAALEQALGLFKQVNNLGRMAAILTNLGEVARTRRDHSRAIQCNEEALTITRNTGNREMERLCLNNLGGSFVGAGDFASAETHLRIAISMIGESRWGGATEVYRLLSEALLGQGRGQEALAAAQTSLQLAQAVNRPENIGEAWRALGDAAARLQQNEVMLAEGRSCTVTHCFAESARLFRAHRLSVSLLQILMTWAAYEQQIGNLSQATLLKEEHEQLVAQLRL